jgi:hypothetical protein
VDKSAQAITTAAGAAGGAAVPAPASRFDTRVLELGLAGAGAPLAFELSPRRIVIPGSLSPGEVVVARAGGVTCRHALVWALL